MAVLAGTDFFTIEVRTWRGLATYYVLFFLHLETRRVTLGGFTRHLAFRTTGQKKDVDPAPLNSIFDRRYSVYWWVS